MSKIKEAVILVGGLGTRLRSLVEIPKCLMVFNGKPLLEYTLKALKGRGVEKFILVVNHQKEMIQNYFGDGRKFGVSIEYVFQENPKGGTADAVRYAQGEIVDEKFFVIYGDNAFDPKILDDILSKSDNYDGVLCGKEMEDVSKYGTLKIEKDLVKEIAEKSPTPPSKIAFTGLMILPKKIFEAIKETPLSKREEFELTTSIGILAEKGYRIGYVVENRFWLDPRNKEDLDAVEEFYKNFD